MLRVPEEWGHQRPARIGDLPPLELEEPWHQFQLTTPPISETPMPRTVVGLGGNLLTAV